MQQIKDIKFSKTTRTGRIAQKTLWYLSISRNALIVLITSCVAYRWSQATDGDSGGDASSPVPFKLSGHVEPGVPHFEWPPFQFEHRNETVTFVQMCTDLGSGIVVVPLVAVLANVAIAKAFCEYGAMDDDRDRSWKPPSCRQSVD